MLRVVPFCSSSKGNSVYIGDSYSGVLVDAGCSYRQLRYYMESNGIDTEAVKAVLITHEHSDHIKGLLQLTKQTGIPVFASKGTAREIIAKNHISRNSDLYDISELGRVQTDFNIQSFPTSHDSAESVGYTFECESLKIGYCTDTGKITDSIRESLRGADYVFLESNYEPALLRANIKYPFYIKNRIASDLGHLSNNDCAAFLRDLVSTGTTRIMLGHLSDENNTSEHALYTVAETLSASGMKCGADYVLRIAPSSCVGKAAAI